MSPDQVVVSQEALGSAGQLQAEWTDLEQRSELSVFLSWQWIGHWLEVYQPEVTVIRVKLNGRTIGLGLVMETREIRHGFLPSRCLRLHQTGRAELDQIWIEYNGFLAEKGLSREVDVACLSFLENKFRSWDEFVIGAIDTDKADFYSDVTGFSKNIRWEAPCYGVNLDRLRVENTPYMQSLSRNTRYQVNRSRRLYEKQGELELVRPANVDEALAMFDRIAPWHMNRWGRGPGRSGFANPEFVRFHRSLVFNQWARGGVDIIAARTGGEDIALFYNLVHQGVVYFYLGGMRSEHDNKLKPGLLGHSLCIEDYLKRGFSYYDFMGGEERYKSNLGERHRRLVQVSLQRPRFKLKLENTLRRAKHACFGEVGPDDGR